MTRAWLAAALLCVAPVVGAQAPVPRRMPPAGMAAGRFVQHVVFDSTYRRERRIWVYTPPGYAAKGHAPYDLVIAFDGADYADTIPLPMVLDTLLAGGHAPPFVAVFIDDSSGAVRLADLANHRRFADMLARQVVPWIRANWNVTREASRTIVTGTSAGGLAAAYVAHMHPELFGNVLSQSGAVWRGDEGANGAPFEALAAKYAAAPKRDIRFVLDVGADETIAVMGGTGPVFIDATRRLRDVLTAKGYKVTYTEIPGGKHYSGTWRPRLGTDIVALTSRW